MAYRILMTGKALDDIDEAYHWYGSKAVDLDARFAFDLDETLQRISENPDAFAKRYKDVRGKLLKKFPYLVLYRTNHSKKEIQVLRVFNTWQNPYWG